MASAKAINEAFLTNKTKNDLEVEKATKRNIDRIDDNDVSEIHTNLMKVFNIKTDSDSKYFSIENFKKFIYKCREDKRAREAKKKEVADETGDNL